MFVRVKHVKVSAVKNKYYTKNTAAAGGKAPGPIGTQF
jgi:hypothetical protein